MGQISIDAQELGKIIAQGIAEGMKGLVEQMAANAPRRKKTQGEFEQTLKTPFIDRAKERATNKRKPSLSRNTFQNGYRLRDEFLVAEEIDLLNKIKKPGRYINRMVEVIIRDEGSEQVLELRYSNKSPDQRFELKNYARSLREICERVLEEGAGQDPEQHRVRTEPVRRPWGGNANTRAAEEAAAALATDTPSA